MAGYDRLAMRKPLSDIMTPLARTIWVLEYGDYIKSVGSYGKSSYCPVDSGSVRGNGFATGFGLVLFIAFYRKRKSGVGQCVRKNHE